ncbi:MAG TPA: ATP-binding protein [Hanamia sp.]|nr:ATP-binding protein [Hanamia sp.]
MDELSQEVIIIVFFSLFIILLIVAIINLILQYQKRQIRFIKEKENLITIHKNELLQTQLEIQEQTFKNISQEIHDNIGQILSLVKLNINTMDCTQASTMQDKVNDSRVLITKAIQDLRDLSKSLNTDYIIEKGLAGAIEYELEMLKRTKAFEIQFVVEGKPYRLEDQERLILFRVVQEALHNIIKHAKATLIKVTLTFGGEYLTLIITDNGAGFDGTQKEGRHAGIGLTNMKNRARMIDADFNINSTLGTGTIITLNLPVSKINA